MRVGWLTTAIFGDLSGYFFGNFRDKASIIILYYINKVSVQALLYDDMLPLVG